MNLAEIAARIQTLPYYEGQAVCVRNMEPRIAAFGEADLGLSEPIRQILERDGVERLYSHQMEAIAAARQGQSVVVVTGTASGKTLCYAIPIVEAVVADPLATALLLYPTKALAQDQFRVLQRYGGKEGIGLIAGTYDGDTPQNQRRKVRDAAHAALTNPDMLHAGILPNHPRWNRFLSHLKYVVIDELHAYRGVFGSHLANVLRRLDRICRHYGSEPTYICSSATIGNPQEHAERILGRPVKLITHDGSPAGPKRFVIWNPPLIVRPEGEPGWRAGGERRSCVHEAVKLLATLMRSGVQTIAFSRTRLTAEMLYRETREALRRDGKRLTERIHAYRGGYLAEDRREIERRLLDRDLLAVTSTNALELGIDIGSLDACILVGYPGSVASMWQQAGRAGRGRSDALVFLVAQNSPMDQYIASHAEYLFGQCPEQATIDADNPHIVIGHVRCAASELPLTDEDLERFGGYGAALGEVLEEEEQVVRRQGRLYWAQSSYPAAEVSLRNISGPVYTIQDDSDRSRVIGTMDESGAMQQLHTNAVYLHEADTYFVTRLDMDQKIAHVERRDLDYYTQAVQVAQLRLDEAVERAERGEVQTGLGDVTVTTTLPMFKKIKFTSRDSLGFEPLDLPPVTLPTVAMWIAPSPAMLRRIAAEGIPAADALLGVANLLVEVAPMFAMCDVSDIGATVDVACLGREAVFLFDRFPGGMGFARRCLDSVDRILAAARDIVAACACRDGCPSCVGSAVPAFAMGDMDAGVRGRFPDKRGAALLLQDLTAPGG